MKKWIEKTVNSIWLHGILSPLDESSLVPQQFAWAILLFLFRFIILSMTNYTPGFDSNTAEELAHHVGGKMTISLRDRSWKEAGQNLEYDILLKLASGKSLKKKALIEVLTDVWKVSQPPSF